MFVQSKPKHVVVINETTIGLNSRFGIEDSETFTNSKLPRQQKRDKDLYQRQLTRLI